MMNRKQVVMLQWIALILLVVCLAGFIVYGLVSRFTGGKSEKKAMEAGNTTTEAQSGNDTEGEEAQAVLPTPTPDPVRTYTLSFAGDCTIGSLIEWQGTQPGDFQSVVGTDYSYPLSGVKSIFAADDLTVVNLEGTFTTAVDAVVKPYRFRADPAYAQVLTEGSVEAVSTSNNHSGDFLEQGLSDTHAALDVKGIEYTHAGAPLIKELDGGLKLGIVTYNTVENWDGLNAWYASVKTDIEACKAADCDLIIGFMHWGTVEYLVEPEDWEVVFAHTMADWGCDLIVGGHAHILQRMEYYNDVPIFYSMGNFCYGGHLNPNDKDSVIVQAEFTRNAETGEVTRSGLRVIPCLVSSQTLSNDYCPTPCAEGSEDYKRIVERLQWSSSDT
ncbi:MAG TPA: hypothetical protein DCZ61_02055 [Lachnospiraceae bacterium]|nr:hypothetical protein [Lachnospiraceae bacterium]